MKNVSEPNILSQPSSHHSYIPAYYSDKATKDKIQKHLTDITDTITEEDIRNIDTSITLRTAERETVA